MTRMLTAVTALCILTMLAVAAIAEPLVYTRQPRLSQAIDVPGYAPIGEAANWQHWYDAGGPNRFTEADLVIDDQNGNVKVIYDCTTKAEICAAHDGRVSPDKTKIAFTVARGVSFQSPKSWADGPFLPPIEFQAASYQIWIYETESKKSSLVEENARQPDWCGNNCLVFTSDRAGDYSPWSSAGNYYPMKSLHVYRAELVE